jgi:hypothetical protein
VVAKTSGRARRASIRGRREAGMGWPTLGSRGRVLRDSYFTGISGVAVLSFGVLGAVEAVLA